MAAKDRELLEAAGIGIQGAAKLLDRSRQSIHQGFTQEKDYFGLEERALFVQDCRRRDSAHLEGLLKFIESRYPAEDADLVLPSRNILSQLEHVLEKSSHVILVFNGNLERLQPDSAFAGVVKALSAHTPKMLRAIVPAPWAEAYLKSDDVGLTKLQIRVDPAVKYQPCFILIENGDAIRAFVFGRHSAEELLKSEAQLLWQNLLPTQIDGEDTYRKVG